MKKKSIGGVAINDRYRDRLLRGSVSAMPKDLKPLVGKVPFFGTEISETLTAMTNFDLTVDYSVAEKLKKGKFYAQYPARNFFGKVWYDKSKEIFVCEVWVFCNIRQVIEGSLEHIMEVACKMWGYD